MAETERPTFEQACRCPRCDKPGEIIQKQPDNRGGIVHVVECKTEGCRWFETRWLVQTDRNRQVVLRGEGEREFEPLKEYRKQAARDKLAFHQAVMERGEIPE